MPRSFKHSICRTTGVLACFLLTTAVLAGCARREAVANPIDPTPHIQATNDVAAGRYLAVVGGCNDCHTPGWIELDGNVPETDWLTGTAVGWRGPWGTTYPPNLRLLAAELDEEEFVTLLHTRKQKPPMPWMNVNRMNSSDAQALYAFLKALGAAGEPAPAALGPEEEPTGPFIPMAPPITPEARH